MAAELEEERKLLDLAFSGLGARRGQVIEAQAEAEVSGAEISDGGVGGD